MYKKRCDFANADEYALYIRNNCAIGMSVRCCRSYEEEVYEGDTGVIVKINYGELHDLNLQVRVYTQYPCTRFAFFISSTLITLFGDIFTICNRSGSI